VQTLEATSGRLELARSLTELGSALRRSGIESLTPAERRVAELAGHGHTNTEIAHALFVTTKTVEWHLANAFRKLGITSRRDLAAALRGDGPS
jgi:DNA-binding CsgD family transcriptional regulator